MRRTGLEKGDRIFVAGGTGLVGAAIIRKLLSSGYTNIVSNYHKRPPAGGVDHSVRFISLDLTRQSETEAFFEEQRPEYVFLAAAKVGGILANDTYRADFIYDNIAIAANVIESAHRYGVVKLLNLGSSCIYPRLAPQPMKEEYLLTGPLEPTNEPYAIAKIAAIKLCRYFNEQYGTDFISVMPANLYGPNDNFNLETSHVIPALIRKFHLAKLLGQEEYEGLWKDVLRHSLGFNAEERIRPGDGESLRSVLRDLGVTSEYVTVWGSGEPFREFLHVDDLAEAVVFMMKHAGCRDAGELVNIGSGKDLSLKNLSLIIKDVVGFTGDIRQDLSKKDGTPRKLLDISLIGRLGWRASIDLVQGIRGIYEEYVGGKGS